MPFYLKTRDLSSDLSAIRSVLIVPCRFCPAASLAVSEGKPYVDLLRGFLRTPAYERYIRELRAQLARSGIKADVFDSAAPHQFVMCMWSAGRRRSLAKRAASYDGLLVLGCNAAAETARQCVASTACQVLSGMDVQGIMNVIPRFRFPFTIWLDVSAVTRMVAVGTDAGLDSAPESGARASAVVCNR